MAEIILCFIKLMSGSNTPGIDQNVYVTRLNGCQQSLYEQLIATNCRASNKIIVFLFHIFVKKKGTSSPFCKNEESNTINMYFIDVC